MTLLITALVAAGAGAIFGVWLDRHYPDPGPAPDPPDTECDCGGEDGDDPHDMMCPQFPRSPYSRTGDING